MQVERLPTLRPPCSASERSTAKIALEALRSAGLEARPEAFRAPTSGSWTPLFATSARLGAAVLLVADATVWVALALAAVSLVSSVAPRQVGRLLVLLPGFGGTSHNIVARASGMGDTDDPPLVVAAHLDAHPSGGAPLGPLHRGAAAMVSLVLLCFAIATARIDAFGGDGIVVLLALEPLAALVRIAGAELRRPTDADADDNLSGLSALVRTAELLAEDPPARTTWIVATGAATPGGWGAMAFLRARPEVRRVAWLVELDALGAAEIVIAPVRRAFPKRSTPGALVRAVVGAALDTGDALDVRRVQRPHSDATAAFARAVPALTLTAGHPPPEGATGIDRANAERAARIVERLARTTL